MITICTTTSRNATVTVAGRALLMSPPRSGFRYQTTYIGRNRHVRAPHCCLRPPVTIGSVSASLSLTLPLVALLLLLAVTSAVMARGGFAGSLRRSGRLGVHSPAAMASDEAFVTANKVAAPVAAGAAVIAAVIAVLLLVLAPSTTAITSAAGVLGDRAARLVPIPAAA